MSAESTGNSTRPRLQTVPCGLSATYILNSFVDLNHAVHDALLVPRHHLVVLLSFLLLLSSVSSRSLWVNSDLVSAQLDIVDLDTTKAGVKYELTRKALNKELGAPIRETAREEVLTKQALIPPQARPNTEQPMMT